jgi:branched-chain amino acid aminotransferase
MKNLMDSSVGTLGFWALGFGLMFGASAGGFIGTSGFFLSDYAPGGDPWVLAFWMFQVVFCATAATIVSGAMVERTKFRGYIFYTLGISAIIYPMFGSWAWGGFYHGSGWLEGLGFIDFAASTVVHSVGGWAALAGAIVLGPRMGKYTSDGSIRPIPGHSIPLAALGVFILWLGWFGFNPALSAFIRNGIENFTDPVYAALAFPPSRKAGGPLRESSSARSSFNMYPCHGSRMDALLDSPCRDIAIDRIPKAARKPRPDDRELAFGTQVTDHMFLLDYTREAGWHDPRIAPYGKLQLDPAALVFHYNQEVFEGLKAYCLDGGGIGLFRPESNIRRMNASARRMVMPEVDPDLFLQAIRDLVLLERDWVPRSEGTSLYIRPTMIATEPAIGVKVSSSYLFYIVLSPVGAYYPEGFSPTRIYVSDEHIRSAPGGAGEAKTSCNYGPTFIVSEMAARKGYTQVLWLDARERKYVEEVGTSNVFFYKRGELITPPLTGSILPGITRDSVIQLASQWGIPVTERPVSIHEVVRSCLDGSLTEMFATGTAAVISPVGEIGYQGRDYAVADGRTGKLSRMLYDELTGIQYGRREDPFGWRVRLA